MNSGPTLHSGSTGPDVRRLQRLLVELKSLSFDHINGNLGPNTEAAVKDFQAGNGLTVDGIVGPQTWQSCPPTRRRRCSRAEQRVCRFRRCKRA